VLLAVLLSVLLLTFVLAVVVSIAFILRLHGDGRGRRGRDALDAARKIVRRFAKLAS
jgi:hypothetical protein